MRASAYIKALPFLLRKQDQEIAYQVYVAESLRLIGANTARFAGGNYLEQKFADLIEPKKEETRTEEEIIAQVRRAWGGDGK